jgi:hypothetical protein
MFKHLILLFIAVCLGLTARAQEGMPVILVSSKGKVLYQSPDSKARQKLINGAVLKRNGTVQLKNKKGSAVLFCDGRFKQLQGKQSFSLMEQFPDAGGMVQLNFDRTFGEFVMAAVIMAANGKNTGDAWGTVQDPKGSGDGWGTVQDPKGSGDGWGTVQDPKGSGDGWGTVQDPKGSGDGWGTVQDPKGSGDGWGGRGHRIVAIQPFGKIAGRTTTLTWSRPSGDQPFQVVVKDDEGNTVKEAVTRDTFLVVDLTPSNFVEGRVYTWNVSVKGDNPAVSNTLFFEIAPASEQASAIQRVEGSAMYRQSPEPLRGLMRAVSLERDDWYGEAARTYRELQKADPGNEMVRMMHAAFWLRQGLRGIANSVYGK